MGEDKCTHDNVKVTREVVYPIHSFGFEIRRATYECLWCGVKGSKDYPVPTRIAWEEE